LKHGSNIVHDAEPKKNIGLVALLMILQEIGVVIAPLLAAV